MLILLKDTPYKVEIWIKGDEAQHSKTRTFEIRYFKMNTRIIHTFSSSFYFTQVYIQSLAVDKHCGSSAGQFVAPFRRTE